MITDHRNCLNIKSIEAVEILYYWLDCGIIESVGKVIREEKVVDLKDMINLVMDVTEEKRVNKMSEGKD